MVNIPKGLLRAGENIIDVKLEARRSYFGQFLPSWLGPQETIEPRYQWLYFTHVTLSAICAVFALTMGLCMLMIWWYRKDAMHGWFALGSLSWACYSLYFFVSDLPVSVESWVRLCFSFGFLMLASMWIFIARFMKWRWEIQERWVLSYAVFGISLLWFCPDFWVFDGIRWLMAGHALLYTALALVLLKTLYRANSKRHAATALIGIGVNIALGLHDWSNIFFMLDQPYFLQYGQPLVFLVMGRHLFRDYMEALSQAQATSEELDAKVRQRERELQASMEAVRQAEQERLLLRERERIMADIHDGVGGHLVSALAIAENAEKNAIMLVSQTIHQALDELRIVIDSLDVEECSLPRMLGAFRYRYDQRMRGQNIQVKWSFEQMDRLAQIAPDVSMQLLRILQELMTNVIKHAQAAHVLVRVGVRKSPSGWHCILSVRDDGVGFSPQEDLQGRGLGNMRRRAQAIGGNLHLQSGARGTLAEVDVPLLADSR